MSIPGTVPVTGIIAPTSSADTYSVTDAIYGLDGLRNVATKTDRNNIPNDRRRIGMIVGVGTTSTTYWKLLPSPWTGTDSDWSVFSSSPITIENGTSLFSTGLNNSGSGSTATSSIFFGVGAGFGTIGIMNSNFIGTGSGSGSTGATNSNFIGVDAGNNSAGSSESIFIGSGAGTGAAGSSGSTFIGQLAGSNLGGSSTNSNFIGEQAGRQSNNNDSSIFFGGYAGYAAFTSQFSNFIGVYAGANTTGITNSNFIGTGAGQGASGSSYSTLIGYNVGNGGNNGSSIIGSNNIIIGTNISLPSGATDSINIGGVLFGSGAYFDSNITNVPSIAAQASGKIGIGVVNPTNTLHVTGATDPVRIQGLTSTTNDCSVLSIDSNGVIHKTLVNDITRICGNNTTVGVYYVDKRYTGVGAAIVSGLTYSSITSTNSSYTSQLNSAIVGNSMNTFPCPWSARNKALDDIAAGLISGASIVVLNGQWTVGSDDPNKNGTVDGTAINANVTADIGFSVANNSSVASIGQDKLAFWFAPNTKLTYINSSYTFYHIYNVDATDTTTFDFSLKGYLDLVFVYGKKNPIVSILYLNYLAFINNCLANLDLEYNGVYVTQGYGFQSDGCVRTFNLKVKYYESTDSVFFTNRFNRNVPSGFASISLDVDTIYGFYNQTDNDFWSMVNLNGDTTSSCSTNFIFSATTLTYDVNIKNITTYTAHKQYDSMFTIQGALPYNTTVNVNVNNLQAYTPKNTLDYQYLVSFPYLEGFGNTINFNFGNVTTVIPLLGPIILNSINSGATNVTSADTVNRVNFHCDNCRKIYDPVIGSNIPLTGAGNVNNAMLSLLANGYCGNRGVGGFVTISGNYTSDNRNAVLWGNGDQVKVLFKSAKLVALNDYPLIELAKTNLYYNTGKYCSVIDSELINTTGSTDVIITGASASSAVTHSVYIKNVHSSNNVASYINQVGDTVLVDANIKDFIK
jgi:hypothetical protein